MSTQYTLAQLLSVYHLTDLKELAKENRIKGYSNLRKMELIQYLSKELLDPIFLEIIFEYASKEDIKQLEKAMKETVVINPQFFFYHYWIRHGLVCVASTGEVFVPSELPALYEKITSKMSYQKYRKEYDLFEQYAHACIELYDIIDLEQFVAIINSQNDTNYKKREIESWASIRTGLRGDELFFYRDGYLMCDKYGDNGLTDPVDARIMLKAQEGKPYYIPEKSVLLKYADYDYVEESVAFKNLLFFMRKKMKLSAENAYDQCASISMLLRSGANFQVIVNECTRCGVIFSDMKQINEFVKYVTELHNNTRLPENRGFTPMELRKVIPDTIDFNDEVANACRRMGFQGFEEPGSNVVPFPMVKNAAPKIYPNDPCPCGSGKKYKKCCGRNK